jgi:hypothetical protein
MLARDHLVALERAKIGRAARRVRLIYQPLFFVESQKSRPFVRG